jgi:4-amino-4-deoxy-L-arabinose transferase-like glycosyltransferase
VTGRLAAGTALAPGRRTAHRGARRAPRVRPGATEPALTRSSEVPLADLRTLALAAAIVGTSVVVYALTAARSIVVGDSPEFVTVAATLGVAHPPGYPLLTMLGHVFSLFPVGPISFRVNLLSVVCHAATVGLVYFTAIRLTHNRAASAVAGLVLGFNSLFWSWSLVVETFPLNDLLVAAMLYLLVLWQERPQRVAPLVLAAFVGGLGMSNHQTIVLLIPAIGFLLWRQRRILLARPHVLAACLGASALGLLPYAYLPWAAAQHPPLNWTMISSLSDLIAHFMRRDYGTGQLISAPAYQGGSPIARVAALLQSLGPSVLFIALGAAHAYRHMRWYFWFVMVGFAAVGPAFVIYSNVNLAVPNLLFVLERFFLLSHVVTAPLMAFGVLLLVEVATSATRGRQRYAQVAVLTTAFAVAAAELVVSYAAVDQSDNHVASDFAEDVLDSLPPNAILLAGGDETVLPISYVQAVEGHRRDVTLIMLGLLQADWYIRQLRESHPDLVLPFRQFDGRSGTTKALVDANQSRPIDVIWAAPDDSLKQNYWYYSRGLVLDLLPVAKDVALDQMTADNERLLAVYRVPSMSTIQPKTFESAILVQYAMAPYRVGEEYELAALYDEARSWYERALTINPEVWEPKWRLSLLPGRERGRHVAF